jgi:hypothetical protein
MGNHNWTWAHLDERQMQALHEAERTLGADYVLAYQPSGGQGTPAQAGPLRAAALDDSQLECLQGLERQIGATLVAYKKG